MIFESGTSFWGCSTCTRSLFRTNSCPCHLFIVSPASGRTITRRELASQYATCQAATEPDGILNQVYKPHCSLIYVTRFVRQEQAVDTCWQCRSLHPGLALYFMAKKRPLGGAALDSSEGSSNGTESVASPVSVPTDDSLPLQRLRHDKGNVRMLVSSPR